MGRPASFPGQIVAQQRGQDRQRATSVLLAGGDVARRQRQVVMDVSERVGVGAAPGLKAAQGVE
jgi:hypothetical protein